MKLEHPYRSISTRQSGHGQRSIKIIQVLRDQYLACRTYGPESLSPQPVRAGMNRRQVAALCAVAPAMPIRWGHGAIGITSQRTASGMCLPSGACRISIAGFKLSMADHGPVFV
ncbi:hypothetical protein [Sphingomonas oryzagri]|uniref:hypothetical protein n=1 Tax=Sphingomonas oryzagri TaxID=3042314 RepID=UPI002478EA31|nr:hypothetical protein [Sphingomonas oryzagri]